MRKTCEHEDKDDHVFEFDSVLLFETFQQQEYMRKIHFSLSLTLLCVHTLKSTY